MKITRAYGALGMVILAIFLVRTGASIDLLILIMLFLILVAIEDKKAG